jgi:hypothetical protein
VRQQVELALAQKERLGLMQSARVLRETINQVEQRITQGSSTFGAPVSSRNTAGDRSQGDQRGQRTIPRAAWATR